MALGESENSSLGPVRRLDVHDQQAAQLVECNGETKIMDPNPKLQSTNVEARIITRIHRPPTKPVYAVTVEDIVAAETLLELFREPRHCSVPTTSFQTSRFFNYVGSDLHLELAFACSRKNDKVLENRQHLQAKDFIKARFSNGMIAQQNSKSTIQEPKAVEKPNRVGRGISKRDSSTSGKHTPIKPQGWRVLDDGIDRSPARIRKPDSLKFVFRFNTERRNLDNPTELITGKKIVYRYLHQADFDWNDRKSIFSLNVWRGQLIRRLFSTHWVAKEKEEIMMLVQCQLDQHGYIRLNRLANEYNSSQFGIVTHLAGEKKLEAKGKTRKTLQADREAPWRTSGSIFSQLKRWPEFKKLLQANSMGLHLNENAFTDDQEVLEPCPASLSIQKSLQSRTVFCQSTSLPKLGLKGNIGDTTNKHVKNVSKEEPLQYVSPYASNSHYMGTKDRTIEDGPGLAMDRGCILREEALTENYFGVKRPLSPSEESSKDL